jgi:hypothetical protein
MIVAVLGGGSIVLLARHAAAERRAEQVRLEAESPGRAPAAASR